MGSKVVVFSTPISDKDLGFVQGSEDLAVEEFIPEFAVKRLDVAVFPGTAGLDEKRLDGQAFKPAFHCLSAKLRAVIGTDVLGWISTNEQRAECFKHMGRVEPPVDDNGQALAGVLVHHREHAERFAVAGPVADEVIGPDMVRVLWPEADAGTVVQP